MSSSDMLKSVDGQREEKEKHKKHKEKNCSKKHRKTAGRQQQQKIGKKWRALTDDLASDPQEISSTATGPELSTRAPRGEPAVRLVVQHCVVPQSPPPHHLRGGCLDASTTAR